MAKRKSAVATAEHKIEEFAGDLTRMLGSAKAKADNWLSQRHAIVKHLSEIRDTASQLLAELGHQADKKAGIIFVGGRGQVVSPVAPVAVVNKLRVGRPAGSGTTKRTMSAEGRARIAAAQKARWAKVKAAKKKAAK